MGSIKYIAKSISEQSTSSRWFATNGDINLNAGKEVAMQSSQKVQYDTYTPPEKENTDPEVEEIQIKTVLDDGYNDSSTLVKGLVYGKVYAFDAVKFKQGKAPTDLSTIRWGFKYETEQGVVQADFKDGHGKKILVSIEALAVCGKNLTIYAYIKNKDGGASLSTWVHYRFRYFDRAKVKEEINQRLSKNYLINQSSTSLCGMAAIFYCFLRIDSGSYSNLALELHQKGTVTLNQYTVKPNSAMYDMQPTAENTKYPGSRKYSDGTPINPPRLMPLVDWIVLASTRSSESNLGYTGEDGQDFSAINWGSVMTKILKDFMGYTTITDNTTLFTGWDHSDTLIQMQKDYQEGYQVILLIDSDMLDDSVSWAGNLTNWHYIVFEGDLFFDTAADKYQFSYFTWGQFFNKKSFRASVFDSNFYGYYKIKK
ncbi:hypothetical protein D0C36_23765 [Mucilaginibacter conchicola]|uniref:Uncharacterized protein n=1 Tax=Mucilaginibacter conchicola TaxID=2303333 RepID=A0A372NMA0_9SPHI|nr:hypothetical protein [Mucilaginibacter conchicola]RFZ89978.1 hypothetical protein D0C36_23765 [Mucilaginibacter conchicola]